MSGAEQETILDTKPKPFVFVLMPFDPAFTDVYQLGIKQACEKAGAYAERLDEQIFNESMLQRIYNQIAKADVVVADMTGRNPNVFYEVGYAHALGKVVILLTQKGEDIPFDLKHYRHIVYENVIGLRPELETAVRWAVKQSGERKSSRLPVAVYGNDVPLIDCPTIDVPYYIMHTKLVKVNITIVCANTDEVNSVSFRIALWASDTFAQCTWGKEQTESTRIHRPGGGTIFNAPGLRSLLPGQWDATIAKLDVTFNVQDPRPVTESMILRIYTDSGSYSYPFTVKIERRVK